MSPTNRTDGNNRMTPTPDSEEFNADPFAADIFAVSRVDADETSAEIRENEIDGEIEKPISWSALLPQVSRSTADWDALLLGLPNAFSEEISRRCAAALARLLDFPAGRQIEFSAFRKREISSAAEFEPENGWWLTVATTSSPTGAAEIFFQIEDALAVQLVDAALSEETPENPENIISRSLTSSETAILEFFALNLTHEANRALNSAQLRFRTLSRQTPRSLERIFDTDSFSMLALDGQMTGDLLSPTTIKIFFAPDSLASLQANGNRQANRNSAVFSNLPVQIKQVRSRLFCGETRLNFGELAALETGDVILLENQQFSVAGGNLSGRAEIFLGEGARRRITGALNFSLFAHSQTAGAPSRQNAAGDDKLSVRRVGLNGSPQMTIESFVDSDAPFFDEYMNETNDNLIDSNQSPGEETGEEQNGLAVENLAVAVRVELEARRLTLAEVGNLRENQTLELGIRPTDEVNILIDDRVVGRGELVAVEERLGVRITKLMR